MSDEFNLLPAIPCLLVSSTGCHADFFLLGGIYKNSEFSVELVNNYNMKSILRN